MEDAAVVLTDKGPVKDCSILISEEGRIRAIASKSSIREEYGSVWEETIDAKECIMMPGMINNHSHIAMTLLRGLAEDLPILNWLRDKIWPLEANLKPWQIEVGGIVGAVESLLSGTTNVNSNYFYDPSGSEASALYNTGMRGTLSHGIFDWTEEKGLRLTSEFVQEWHGRDQGRLRIATGAHSAYSCSPGLLKKIEDLRGSLNEKFGEKYPILSTIHVAEARTEANEIDAKYVADAKRGIADYLLRIGVLTKDTVAAHCIHLLDDDYAAFKKAGASIASCPVSNLKVGMGIADLTRDMAEGITVSLGTDGPASNNTLDMFETTKMASLLQKGIKGEATLLSSKLVFELATIGGAKSLHQENEIGSLAIGKRADIVIVDLSRISAVPFYDPYNHLAYSARGGDVKHVLVDGRIVVRDGKIRTVDLEKMKEMVSRAVYEVASGSLVKA